MSAAVWDMEPAATPSSLSLGGSLSLAIPAGSELPPRLVTYYLSFFLSIRFYEESQWAETYEYIPQRMCARSLQA